MGIVGRPIGTHGIPRYTVGNSSDPRGIPRGVYGIPWYTVKSRGNSLNKSDGAFLDISRVSFDTRGKRRPRLIQDKLP